MSDRDVQSDDREMTRRHFLAHCQVGLGGIALATLLGESVAEEPERDPLNPMAPRPAHSPGKVKSVIFLSMAGAPSQLDLFDDKPRLRELHGQAAPDSFMEGKQFAFLKEDVQLLGSPRKFGRYGESGAVLSDLLPYHRQIVDEICFVKSFRTDVFNHGPAKIFMNTGSPQPGRPSMGSWVTYGIGSECNDLPGFVVLQSGSRGPRAGSALC